MVNPESSTIGLKFGRKKNDMNIHFGIIQQGKHWVEIRIMGCDPLIGLEMDLVGSKIIKKIK